MAEPQDDSLAAISDLATRTGYKAAKMGYRIAKLPFQIGKGFRG